VSFIQTDPDPQTPLRSELNGIRTRNIEKGIMWRNTNGPKILLCSDNDAKYYQIPLG
jgi:hypothetical protein